MVEIEGSTTCIYMRIRVLNVLGNRGVCRDTIRGCRAFVVLHNLQWVVASSTTGTCLPVCADLPARRVKKNGVSVKSQR
jgi:hypothetical protein